MEVLSPSPPPSPCPSGSADGLCLRRGGRWEPHHGQALLHVAVGRSPEKTMGMLRWVLRRFGCCRIALLHVHQPSPLIPTLLGKIPSGQATEELVLSHRKSEKEEMNKILLTYLAFCNRAQVQAALLVTENEQIHDGILSLVNQYGITKLVMGSTPDSCFKLKAAYGKGSVMARNAPAFCEIWFVWRGRHIWTREATAAANKILPLHTRDDAIITKRIRLSSNSNSVAESIVDEGYITCETSIMTHLNQGMVSDNDEYNDYQALGRHDQAGRFCSDVTTANWQDREDDFVSTSWSDSSVPVHMETSKDIFVRNLKQVMMDAEESRKDAFVELLRRKEAESKVAGVLSRVKASESATKHEIKIRREHEVLLVGTRKQHEELRNNKEKAASGLNSSMRRLVILDARTKKMSLWMQELGADLELIRSSIEILREEESKLLRLDGRYTNQVAGYIHSHLMSPNCTSITHASSQDRPNLTPGMVRDLEQLHLMKERHVPQLFPLPDHAGNNA